MHISTQWGHEMNFSLLMHLGLPERQSSCSLRAKAATSGTLCSASIGSLPSSPITQKEHEVFVLSSRRWNCNKHNTRLRDMPMEPFGLKLDTEQLGALEVYKGTLMEPVEKKKKKKVFLCLWLDDPVLISSDFCTREVLDIIVLTTPHALTSM